MASKQDLENLHNAVQAFSNSLCKDASDAGSVVNALIVWEEVAFSEDGDPETMTAYCVTGPISQSAGLGLAAMAVAKITADITGH